MPEFISELTPEADSSPPPGSSSASDDESTSPRRRGRRINAAGAPNTKGGKEVARQNFSMHPDLMKAIFEASHQLSGERTAAIIDDRAKRITYSKIVAALVWMLKTRYMTPDEKITAQLRQLIADYEASPFERPDDSHNADAIMEERALYATRLSQSHSQSHADVAADGEAADDQAEADDA